jgi:flagellar protein FlaF
MGLGSLIASAVAIILLVITAYVIIGGTIATAEVVALAQDEQAHTLQKTMRTSIEIGDVTVNANASVIYVDVYNAGSEIIADFDNMDVFVVYDAEPQYIPSGTGPGTWVAGAITPDAVHPGQLDPEETVNITVTYTGGDPPAWIQVTTGNGVCDSTYVT